MPRSAKQVASQRKASLVSARKRSRMVTLTKATSVKTSAGTITFPAGYKAKSRGSLRAPFPLGR